MDGNHPKNKGTHPRRAKAKDNPYTIYTTGSDNDHPKYILEFTDGQKRPLRLEIDQALYELFDQFELEDKRFLNEVDRHYEHIDLTEAEMRALIQRQYNTLPDTKTAKQLWTSMQK